MWSAGASPRGWRQGHRCRRRRRHLRGRAGHEPRRRIVLRPHDTGRDRGDHGGGRGENHHPAAATATVDVPVDVLVVGEEPGQPGFDVGVRLGVGQRVAGRPAADLVDRGHQPTSSTRKARASDRRALNSDVFTVPAVTSRISAICVDRRGPRGSAGRPRRVGARAATAPPPRTACCTGSASSTGGAGCDAGPPRGARARAGAAMIDGQVDQHPADPRAGAIHRGRPSPRPVRPQHRLVGEVDAGLAAPGQRRRRGRSSCAARGGTCPRTARHPLFHHTTDQPRRLTGCYPRRRP